MEQKFEGSPHADVRLEGRRAVRGEVVHDWGSREELTTSCDSCGADYALVRRVSVDYEAFPVKAKSC